MSILEAFVVENHSRKLSTAADGSQPLSTEELGMVAQLAVCAFGQNIRLH